MISKPSRLRPDFRCQDRPAAHRRTVLARRQRAPRPPWGSCPPPAQASRAPRRRNHTYGPPPGPGGPSSCPHPHEAECPKQGLTALLSKSMRMDLKVNRKGHMGRTACKPRTAAKRFCLFCHENAVCGKQPAALYRNVPPHERRSVFPFGKPEKSSSCHHSLTAVLIARPTNAKRSAWRAETPTVRPFPTNCVFVAAKKKIDRKAPSVALDSHIQTAQPTRQTIQSCPAPTPISNEAA